MSDPAARRRWLPPSVLVLLVAAGTVVVLVVGVPSVEQLRAGVGAAGWAAPLAFAGLYALLALTPVPASVFSIAAGLLFGVAAGVGVVLAGALLAATVAFALARTLGRDAVVRVDSDRLRRLDRMLARRGLLAVVGVRLVPLLGFAALNYAFGLTGVRFRDYLPGTAIGILPGVVAYVTVGAYGTEPGSAPFLVALGGLVLLAVGGVVVSRRRRGPTAGEA